MEHDEIDHGNPAFQAAWPVLHVSDCHGVAVPEYFFFVFGTMHFAYGKG